MNGKVLVREEVRIPVTKYVNAVSLVRAENDKGTESDMVIDENIAGPVKLVDKGEAINKEKSDKPNGSTNKISTKWGKYVDRLLKMPRSQPIGYYLKHKINENNRRSYR
ncbi:hypothetical protein Tco_1003205 [Tanacetum coccineum]|uniref:Uncharacterized protein n=1 Tax=Tanacetum coccineum TaxID=301880 RepID=A0ABQ5F8S7_9ASTR